MLNQDLYPMIFKRKSFHIFRQWGDERISQSELDELTNAFASLSPLDGTIRTEIRIVPAQQTSCRRGQEYCILFYSEHKDNYLLNIGYLGQQVDLILAARNIGSLWFGIGKTDEKSLDGLDFVIMIAIRKISDPSKFRKDIFKAKRKPIEEIWQGENITGVTDIVRFAPSACNTQPWKFVMDQNKLQVFRYRQPGKRGIMPENMVSYYNQIDMGIALLYLELCLSHEAVDYSRALHVDPGDNRELTIIAEYELHWRNNHEQLC